MYSPSLPPKSLLPYLTLATNPRSLRSPLVHHSIREGRRKGSLIPINNPQTPPRIQQHPHECRLLPPHQILTAAIRRAVSANRHPVSINSANWRHGRWNTISAVSRRARPRRRAALFRRASVFAVRFAQEGHFLVRTSAAAVGERIALRHRHMALIQRQLPAIDPGAEAEVAGEDEEDACHHASDNGGDVRARRTVVGRRDGRGCGACLGHDGAVGACDRVCALDGVGDRFACCHWTCCGGASGGSDCCASGNAATDDGLNGCGDLVAIGAGEAEGVFLLGDLLILGVGFGVTAVQGGEGVCPCEVHGIKNVYTSIAAETESVVASYADDLAVE